MPRKQTRKFSVPKEVRRQARERVGAPPPSKVEPDRRRKPPKHKKNPAEEDHVF